MKRRTINYEVTSEQRFHIIVYAISLNSLWYITIAKALVESHKLFEFSWLTILYIIASVVLVNHFKNKLERKFLKEIDKATRKHVEEFFDYMESDKQFSNDVLIKDVTLYNLEREKIGTGSVYSQLSQKKQSFFKEIE